MSDYRIVQTDEVPDVLGDYPGEMRFLTDALEADQVAISYRRMPRNTGGKGGYGHRHKTQEEIYFVASGTLQFKLEDEVVDVAAPAAVRVAPHTVRSVWNDGPQDAELIIVSPKLPEDSEADAEKVEGFWP